MVLFPIVLILVLSTALKSIFSTKSVDLSGDKVAYCESGNIATTDTLDEFAKMEKKPLGLNFVKVTNKQKALNGLKDGIYATVISAEGNKILYYENSNPTYNFDGDIIEPVLKEYTMRAGAIVTIIETNPQKAAAVGNSSIGNFVNSRRVNFAAQSSLDYYGVEELLLIIMYGALTALHIITSDKKLGTMSRLYASPAKRWQIFVGQILGCISIVFVQAMIVLVVSTLCGANWGKNIGLVIAIILSEIIMAEAIGVAAGMVIKNTSAANSFLNLLICLIVMLGGGYAPLTLFSSKLVQDITYFSPMRWSAQAIFDSAAGKPADMAFKAVAINLIIAVILIAVSSVKLGRKREVL